MASVETRKDANGKVRYAARWREDGKQRKSWVNEQTGQPFKSEPAAKKYGDEQAALYRRGLTPHRSDVTVGEWAAHWAASKRKHRPGTARRIGYMIKHLSATGLADRKLTDVRHSHIQAWVDDRSEVLALSTLKKAVSDLGSIFRQAVRDKLIPESPVHSLQYPEADEEWYEHYAPLTVPQVRALADAMPDRYRVMVLAQAGLGLRVGELLGLRVSDVDLRRRKVRIEVQFVAEPKRDKDGNRLRSELKTKTSKRTLPLPVWLAEELAAHLAKYGPGKDGSVFTTSAGNPVSTVYLGKLFRRYVPKAGLPVGTTSHDLRHHYATELLGAGLTFVEVGHKLGHKDGTLVAKVYGHSRVDTDDLAEAALNKAWGRLMAAEAA